MTDHKRGVEPPAIDIANPEVQRLLNETKDQLKGHERRLFMEPTHKPIREFPKNTIL